MVFILIFLENFYFTNYEKEKQIFFFLDLYPKLKFISMENILCLDSRRQYERLTKQLKPNNAIVHESDDGDELEPAKKPRAAAIDALVEDVEAQ